MNAPQVVYFLAGVLAYFPSGARMRSHFPKQNILLTLWRFRRDARRIDFEIYERPGR
jgi:hypothetical protein